MNKPKYLQARYDQKIEFDLSELDIDWDKVIDHYIKYSELTVEFEDGEVRTYDPTYRFEIDWKWADSEKIYDSNFKVVEEDL
jgi:hypothetical protein